MTMKNNRVYLAGPDVFYPNAVKIADDLKKECALWGLEGVFPLDSEIKLEEQIDQESAERNGYRIYKGNIELIKSCAAVLANISPFRGPSVDAGTAFEMGFGKASGLIVVGYTTQKTLYKDRVRIPDGLMVEDFGMIDNLMIHCATESRIFSSPKEAIGYLSNALYS
jgi:nucleoside 2-deoxyribosyltransferase